MVDPRLVNEERSIAMHRVVAERLRQDPRLIVKASERVESWLRGGGIHPVYGERWLALLKGPLDQLVAGLTDPRDEFRALRQCSPFAGVIDHRERWRIWRETRAHR